MNSQVPIIGDENKLDLTRKAMEDAAADARHLMANSKIVSTLVATDIIARQLFLLVRGGLENEIVNGWDVEEPKLVIQTLGMSAQEKAVEAPVKASQIRKALLETVLPVVDIFCQMEEQHDRAKAENPTPPVSGSDDGSTERVGTILRGATGDAEQQAGIGAEGDRGEEAKAE